MTARLRQLTVEDAPALVALRDANREHFLMGEPIRGDEWFTVEAQAEWITGEGIAFGGFAADGALVAYARLSQVVRGGFQNAYLGYAVDHRHGNMGIATALVEHVVGFAFGDLGLHRVQANARTDNPASKRVLAKAGFRHEGVALRYLNIGGDWRDHDMFAITAEEWPPRR